MYGHTIRYISVQKMHPFCKILTVAYKYHYLVILEHHVIICKADEPFTIFCNQTNHVISIHYANYGRTQPQEEVCTDGYSYPINNNCISGSDVIKAKCNDTTSCMLTQWVVRSVEGDPCPGNEKYFELYYVCVGKMPGWCCYCIILYQNLWNSA